MRREIKLKADLGIDVYELDLLARLKPFHARPTSRGMIAEIQSIVAQWATDWSFPPSVEYDREAMQFVIVFDSPPLPE
jgi:hypothetical protein